MSSCLRLVCASAFGKLISRNARPGPSGQHFHILQALELNSTQKNLLLAK